MSENPSAKKSGPLIVFLASLLWAGDGPFRKPLLTGGLAVGFVSFLEHACNTAVSVPGLVRERAHFKNVTPAQWLGLLYIGAGASAVAALLFVQAAVVMNYNFTVAALLQKLQPLFAIVLAVFFLKERLKASFWLYALPALLGAYLVTFGLSSPREVFLSGTVTLQGSLLAIAAAALWAGGTVVGRSLLAGVPLQLVNGMRFVFGLLFLSLFTAYTHSFGFGLMTLLFWRNVLIIALLTGFFALLLYYYGLKSTRATVATLMELGYPLALTLVNWKFLGITLSPWQLAGALLLLVSVTVLVINNSNINQTHE